jgi:PAS domain S-box-containing protein
MDDMSAEEKTKKQFVEDLAEALQASEQRAALLLKAAALGIHECDAEGRITFVNPSQERITGYTADELVGTCIWDRIEPGPHKDSLPAFLKHLVLEQPPPTPYVTRNIRKNGELFDIRVDWSYQRNSRGQVTGFVSIISDITEQLRAEQALRESENRYRQLAESTAERVKERTAELLTANEQLAVFRRFAEASGQGFGMADLDGHITYVNPALCRLFGEEKPEDALGKHVGTYYREEYLQRRNNELLPALSREGHWQGEETLRSLHGSPTPVLQNTFLIRDENGNPFRFASVITDITERKQAEEALRQSHDELQAIYDGMVDGLLIVDIETKRFIRANAAICRMLG